MIILTNREKKFFKDNGYLHLKSVIKKKKIFISEKKIDVFDLKNYKKKIKKQVAIIKTFDKKIFKILNNKKIKIDEKINDLEPIIKGFTVFEKKTSLTDIISVYKKTYQNLLIRNKKIEI